MWYLAVSEEDQKDSVLLEDLEESETTSQILQNQRLQTTSALWDDSHSHPKLTISRYFGAVPPRKEISILQLEAYTDRLAAALSNLEALDGILVYEIQEEESHAKGGGERPYAYSATHEPRVFARRLAERVRGKEIILYRTVAYHAKEEDYVQWLKETKELFRLKNLVLVGGSSSAATYPGYTVIEAARIAREVNSNFNLGGITIPERHRDKGKEHLTLVEKSKNGISFFTSQVVYNADLAIWLLRDYDEICKKEGLFPSRIIFTFAPFGRQNTAEFLKWLGVEIPEGTEKRVLSRQNIKDCVREAVDICRENFRRILNAIEHYAIAVPIGYAVESVSKYRDEFTGSLQLYEQLHREALIFEKPFAPTHVPIKTSP